ncbi:Villin headpiece domain, partial [Musa troglodytarum]
CYTVIQFSSENFKIYQPRIKKIRYQVTSYHHSFVIYSINGGQLKLEEDNPSKALLENNKCYLLDCGAEIFVWVGRVTQVDDRKAASKAAEDFIIDQNRPKMTCITQVIQGYETQSFKSNFESWPVGTGTGTGTSSGDEARGKVAALLKQQGVDVKGAPKGSLVSEEIPPLIEGNEKLEVCLTVLFSCSKLQSNFNIIIS